MPLGGGQSYSLKRNARGALIRHAFTGALCSTCCYAGNGGGVYNGGTLHVTLGTTVYDVVFTVADAGVKQASFNLSGWPADYVAASTLADVGTRNTLTIDCDMSQTYKHINIHLLSETYVDGIGVWATAFSVTAQYVGTTALATGDYALQSVTGENYSGVIPVQDHIHAVASWEGA